MNKFMKLISKACVKNFWQQGSLGHILWACPEVACFWKNIIRVIRKIVSKTGYLCWVASQEKNSVWW